MPVKFLTLLKIGRLSFSFYVNAIPFHAKIHCLSMLKQSRTSSSAARDRCPALVEGLTAFFMFFEKAVAE